MPIYEEEWNGDEHIGVPPGEARIDDAGTVVFKGDQLPWMTGEYELRYHHDGKHNVMSRIAPFEIYGE
jgi:phosphatidylethanolamine N-methyltransferase